MPAASVTVGAVVGELVLLSRAETMSELPAGTAWFSVRLAAVDVAPEVPEATRPTKPMATGGLVVLVVVGATVVLVVVVVGATVVLVVEVVVVVGATVVLVVLVVEDEVVLVGGTVVVVADVVVVVGLTVVVVVLVLVVVGEVVVLVGGTVVVVVLVVVVGGGGAGVADASPDWTPVPAEFTAATL